MCAIVAYRANMEVLGASRIHPRPGNMYGITACIIVLAEDGLLPWQHDATKPDAVMNKQ